VARACVDIQDGTVGSCQSLGEPGNSAFSFDDRDPSVSNAQQMIFQVSTFCVAKQSVSILGIHGASLDQGSAIVIIVGYGAPFAQSSLNLREPEGGARKGPDYMSVSGFSPIKLM